MWAHPGTAPWGLSPWQLQCWRASPADTVRICWPSLVTAWVDPFAGGTAASHDFVWSTYQ